MFCRTAARTGAAALIVTAAALNVASASDVPLDGPPAPVAPAVINRDDTGRATMRAFRLDAPLWIDGRLDE